MAHIERFSIEGLAGRKDTFSRDLNRDINIFFGLNGSGKTSLLKILHSALSGDTIVLNNVPFKTAEVQMYSNDFKKSFTLSIEQIQIENSSEMELYSKRSIRYIESPDRYIESPEYIQLIEKYPSKLAWKYQPKLPKTAHGSWAHKYLPTSRVYENAPKLFSSSGDRTLTEEALDVYFARAIETLWTDYFSNILSTVRKAQEDGLASILKDIMSPPNINENDKKIENISVAYKRVSAFLERQGSKKIIGTLHNFEERFQSNPQFKNIVSDINEVEKKIETATAPKEKLQELIKKLYSGNKAINFEDKGITVRTLDNKNIGLQFLSSGEKQVLRIFIETLRAESNSIFVDEPELSLHIDWQKQLIADMQLLNPNTQIIFATHSPEIMAEVDDNRIFRL